MTTITKFIHDRPEVLLLKVVKTTTVVEVHQFTRRAHRRCRELGIELQDIAARMGVTKGRIAQQIRRAQMDESVFLKLSEALEMTTEDWLRPIPSQFSKEDGHYLIQQRTRQRVRKYRALGVKLPKEGK